MQMVTQSAAFVGAIRCLQPGFIAKIGSELLGIGIVGGVYKYR